MLRRCRLPLAAFRAGLPVRRACLLVCRHARYLKGSWSGLLRLAAAGPRRGLASRCELALD
eukprot:7691302-Lingulodinium_polyedra.AAC.1